MKIVGYFGLLILIGMGAVAGAWYWKNNKVPTDSQNTVNQASFPTSSDISDPQTSTTPSVLGSSDELLLPSALYGLINGLRREKRVSQLSVNPSLEKTAQWLLSQSNSQPSDATELAKSLGFLGKAAAEVRAIADHSSWKLFTELQTDPRNALRLESPTFSEIGAAIRCQQDSQDECVVLVLMGEK